MNRIGISSAQALEPLTPTGINPLTDRMDNLGLSIEAPMVPGVDSRVPAVEGALSALLPDPPPPPKGVEN